jgi:hypothetical protein
MKTEGEVRTYFEDFTTYEVNATADPISQQIITSASGEG